jgi:hypothetical protein
MVMRTYYLKQTIFIKRQDRFFYYEPLSMSSFRKNLIKPEASPYGAKQR